MPISVSDEVVDQQRYVQRAEDGQLLTERNERTAAAYSSQSEEDLDPTRTTMDRASRVSVGAESLAEADLDAVP